MPKNKIFYFSDQFYIFYNNFDYNDNDIYNTVSKIIGKDYFELTINGEDSKVYNYENLLSSRDFSKKVSELVKIQKSTNKDDLDLDKLLHFFNAFVEDYYTITEKSRLSFVEVVLKSVFSSPVNLYRLSEYFTIEENDDIFKIINILIFFLKNYPSLIIFYIKIGLWNIISEYSNYIYMKGKDLKKYFEIKLKNNINTIDAVYYFHICYALTEKNNKKNYCLQYYKNNKGKNLLLDSIIVETCNIKENKNVVLNYKFNDENWLINYTKFMQIRYYIKENRSSNCIIKTINKCKKNKIKIIRSFDEIKFDQSKENAFKMIELKMIDNEEEYRHELEYECLFGK